MRRTFPAALAFAAVGFSALENGGFFPTSWGWPAIAFLVTVAVVSLLADRVRFARADMLLLFPLAGFLCWTALSALWSPGAQLPIQGAQLALVYVAAVAAILLLGDAAHRAAVAAPRRLVVLALGVPHAGGVAAIGRGTRRSPTPRGARRPRCASGSRDPSARDARASDRRHAGGAPRVCGWSGGRRRGRPCGSARPHRRPGDVRGPRDRRVHYRNRGGRRRPQRAARDAVRALAFAVLERRVARGSRQPIAGGWRRTVSPLLAAIPARKARRPERAQPVPGDARRARPSGSVAVARRARGSPRGPQASRWTSARAGPSGRICGGARACVR